jgi:cytochrome b561
MLKGMKNPTRYTSTAIGLHWLIALLIIVMLGVGLYMVRLPDAMPKFQLIQLHKSIGITVLGLVALRLLWRFTHPAPMLPKAMPQWQKAVAHASHYLLYILMVAMPLSGWIMSDAAGYHPNWFGLSVPQLASQNPELSKTLAMAHGYGAYLLIVLLCLHIGAALQHHFWDNDDILKRMLPKSLAKAIPQPRLKSLTQR